MNHLTDEQLSALLDDALKAGERAACDAHLAGCDACRARLAEASALDTSLGRALTHDPGESYFADFAERVAKRIAAQPSLLAAAPEAKRQLDAAPEAPKAPKSASTAPRSLWAWFTSPRGLALAGSTAALLVTAGIAWMRFHNEQDVTRALHEAAPNASGSRASKQSAESDELAPSLAPPPAASTPAPPGGTRARSDAAPRDLARMQEVRTLPNGEQVPVARTNEQGGAPAGQEASGNALAAPATGSTIAQMKRRSVAPAAESGAPAAGAPEVKTESAPREEAQRLSKDTEPSPAPAQKLAAPPPPTAPPQAKASLATDSARGRSFSTWGASKSLYNSGNTNELKALTSDARKLQGLASTCGRVRDARGLAVAGAQVTAVHDGVRTARTDAGGEFCIDGLAAGDTLTVMHVGFDPWTAVVTPMTSLAITLDPVGTLGPNATMITGRVQAPSPSFSGALHEHGITEPAFAPRPDVYEGQSSTIRQLVLDAREATSVARREHTAPGFESAAKKWAAVQGQVKGAPAYDASFQVVSSLRSAYQLEPTSERGGRLRSAIAAFLATAPATLPERATVEHWQAELKAPPGR